VNKDVNRGYRCNLPKFQNKYFKKNLSMKLIQDLRDILIRDINTRTLLASIESGVEKDGKKRGIGRFLFLVRDFSPPI